MSPLTNVRLVWKYYIYKQSKSQHGKKQRLGGPVSWNCNLISKFEVWQVRSHVNTDCSGISVVLRTYWAPYWMQHIPCQKKDHFRQLLAQAGLHFLILHPSGQGSQKMQWDCLNVKWHIWPWLFLHQYFVFRKLLVLVCGRLGVHEIKSIFSSSWMTSLTQKCESMENGTICVQCMKDNRRKPNLD